MTTTGIHHVTAIAGDPQRNVDFYTGVLGLRLVKRTVNFDDPESYHFYFGDERGTPGSLITFFPWPGARPGRAGVGQVAVTSLAIAPSSIGYWVQRLVTQNVPFQGPTRPDDAGTGPIRSARGGLRDGAQVLAFRDPDGLMLELVAHPSAERRPAWGGGTVPAPHAIHGVYGVTLWVHSTEPTARVLATLGFRATAGGDGLARFEAGDGGAGAIVGVRPVGGFLAPVEGPGTVHHVAFRAPDDARELELRVRVAELGLQPTPVRDRSYFRSVYFREPGGVLFEIATDGPGFAIDEPVERLGESLRLPPRLEPRRARLERALPPVHLPGTPMAGAAAHPDPSEDA